MIAAFDDHSSLGLVVPSKTLPRGGGPPGGSILPTGPSPLEARSSTWANRLAQSSCQQWSVHHLSRGVHTFLDRVLSLSLSLFEDGINGTGSPPDNRSEVGGILRTRSMDCESRIRSIRKDGQTASFRWREGDTRRTIEIWELDKNRISNAGDRPARPGGGPRSQPNPTILVPSGGSTSIHPSIHPLEGTNRACTHSQIPTKCRRKGNRPSRKALLR